LEPSAQICITIDSYYQRQNVGRFLASFFKYKVHADIRGGSSWRGPQMRVWLSTTAIFGNLSGYLFENFRDKARNILWRYATPRRPVVDCKTSDLE